MVEQNASAKQLAYEFTQSVEHSIEHLQRIGVSSDAGLLSLPSIVKFLSTNFLTTFSQIFDFVGGHRAVRHLLLGKFPRE